MTTSADARAVEAAFEAALAGRPAPAGAPDLTAFTDAVRAGATAPGRPNAALAELLATGLLPDAATRPVGRSTQSSRKRPRMILTTLVAKFAAAGAVAKASVAGGAVAVALTGAVTADVVLPEADDDTAVIESGDTTDPDLDAGTGEEPATEDGEAPTGEESGTPSEEEPVDGVPVEDPAVAGPGEVPALDDWLAGPDPDEPFGQWVSEGEHQGWTNGALVSCYAQLRHEKRELDECRALAAAPSDGEEPVVEEPVVEEPVEQPEVTAPQVVEEPAPAPTGGAGSGNGGGNGNAGGNGNGNGGGRR